MVSQEGIRARKLAIDKKAVRHRQTRSLKKDLPSLRVKHNMLFGRIRVHQVSVVNRDTDCFRFS